MGNKKKLVDKKIESIIDEISKSKHNINILNKQVDKIDKSKLLIKNSNVLYFSMALSNIIALISSMFFPVSLLTILASFLVSASASFLIKNTILTNRKLKKEIKKKYGTISAYNLDRKIDAILIDEKLEENKILINNSLLTPVAYYGNICNSNESNDSIKDEIDNLDNSLNKEYEELKKIIVNEYLYENNEYANNKQTFILKKIGEVLAGGFLMPYGFLSCLSILNINVSALTIIFNFLCFAMLAFNSCYTDYKNEKKKFDELNYNYDNGIDYELEVDLENEKILDIKTEQIDHIKTLQERLNKTINEPIIKKEKGVVLNFTGKEENKNIKYSDLNKDNLINVDFNKKK